MFFWGDKMIREISIQNIALIDELTISFDEGFNVLTGETGAGKSIIIDSVNLALGERADRDLIQAGKDYARVELLFSLTENQKQVNDILSEFGIPSEEDGSLLLMRELTNKGRNLCKVNGCLVTLSMLRRISNHLVDVHGQHQHQSLLTPESHISFLDRLGEKDMHDLKIELANNWYSWQKIKKEIDKIQGWNQDGERRKDVLRYQIDEIIKAELKPEEEEDLKKERSILAHAERIVKAVSSAYQMLYSGNSSFTSVQDSLAETIGKLQSVQGIDNELDSIINQLEALLYNLEDSINELRAYRDGFDYDPSRLELLDARLDVILAMKRKYGQTVEDILQLKTEMESELDMLDNSQERLEILQEKSRELYKLILEQCRVLSKTRKMGTFFRRKNSKRIE